MGVLRRDFGEKISNPKISIIIVTYRDKKELKDCLSSLKKQTYKDFETIVVDNDFEDIEFLEKYSITYYRLGKNYGPSYARNYGAAKARGSLLSFLDDDAVAHKHLTQGIVDLFEDKSIVGIRGKVVPKTEGNIYSLMSRDYDLGESVINAPMTLECNCAVRRKIFNKVGGFNPNLYGHEGIDLSYRLSKYGKQVYAPNVLVYHNSSNSLRHYLEREMRQGYNGALLSIEHPEFIEYMRQFIYPLKPKNMKKINSRQKLQIVVIRKMSNIASIFGLLHFRLYTLLSKYKKTPPTETS